MLPLSYLGARSFLLHMEEKMVSWRIDLSELIQSAWLSPVAAEELCFSDGDFCVTGRVLRDAQEFEVTMTAPLDIGYLSVGLGDYMEGSDVIVAWSNDNTTFSNYTISDRMAYAYTQPPYDRKQDARLVPEKTGLYNGRQTVTFRRLLNTNDSADIAVIPGIKQPWLWAVAKKRPVGNYTVSVPFHTGFGRFEAVLTEAGMTGTHRLTKDIGSMAFWHGIVMAVVWMVAAPVGAFIPRFLRTVLGPAWFPSHWTIMGVIGVSLTTIGFALGYVATKGRHFNTPHKIIGMTVFVATLLQALLGIYIDRTYNPARERTPFRDHLHRFFGYGLILLSMANVYLGLLAFHIQDVLWIFILFGVWVGIMLFSFINTHAFLAYSRKKRKSEEMVQHHDKMKD
ncbi:uncharacterized protein VTP21DRAFT_1238 [Calcarisporiella thermophila]|uniref:uncharacterized protein n=1 Tax=Calcarisporiella thermophila TaxID=911321 RepID=UPI00374263E3